MTRGFQRLIGSSFSMLCAGGASMLILCGMYGGCSFWNPPPGSGSSAPVTIQGIQTRNTEVLSGNGQIVSAVPRPNQPVLGEWSYNDTNPIGNVTEFGIPKGTKYTAYTNATGSYEVDNFIQNANWILGVNYIGGCNTDAMKFKQLPAPLFYELAEYIPYQDAPFNFDCTSYLGSSFEDISPQFVLNSSLPSTISVQADTPLSFSYGPPQLLVYNRTGSVVATENASSVDSTGINATFPYPAGSSGALMPDMYGTAILNTNSDGTQSYAGGGSFFSIGDNANTYPEAFGVAAAESTTRLTICIPITRYHSSCNTSVVQNHYPVVTLAGNSSVSWNGHTVTTGAQPEAVATYGTGNTSTTQNNWTGSVTTDVSGTAFAIAVNSGSNSVSLLNLLTPGVITTLGVGSTPVAISLSADQSLAYVVNYSSGSISVVSLTNRNVIGTYTIGGNPDAIDVDYSGNLWVGGNGYIEEVSGSTYQILQTISVAGTVTSLAVSNALGKVVATVAPSAGTSGTLSVQSYSILGGQQSYSLGIGSTTAYAASSISGRLVNPAQLGTGTLVSANYGNDISISASPGGFVVTEVSTGGTVMTGSTPYPIRAIAVDPNYGQVYLTVPDSNAVITVPLPPVPTG
ncbi:MAG: hypothetical protein HKL84_08105 [Acidimicrobiaceae bacterium]|nr:hypothetical protein [Acidimicrobiaceae bacterium]